MIVCYCRVSSQRQKNGSQQAEIMRGLEDCDIASSVLQWFEDKESGHCADAAGGRRSLRES